MGTSDYTEPFEIVRVSFVIDDRGGQVSEKRTVFRGFCKVTNLVGSEFWSAYSVGQTDVVKVRTRWNPVFDGLDKRKHALVMRGREYDIVSCGNVGWRNEECEIKAEERIHG